jgi:hypothetical protein
VRALARVQPTSSLLVGTRRVAIVADQGYYEPGAPVQLRGTITTELAKLRAQFNSPELFLGTHPIVVGGEEHHEKHLQLTPAPREVALDGHLVRVAALPTGIEVWQYDEKLQAHLAVVAADGTIKALPDHPLVGPPLVTDSPVLAKQCATPKIADLVATADAVIALIVECSPRAPVRLMSYRWPGPSWTVETVGTSEQFGFEPLRVVASSDRRALVGLAKGKVAIHRFTRTPDDHVLDGITRVIGAAMSDDGAVWTLTIATGDVWQVARNGIVVPTSDASGAVLRPAQLGFDARHGVVILARNAASVWLISER